MNCVIIAACCSSASGSLVGCIGSTSCRQWESFLQSIHQLLGIDEEILAQSP